MSKARRSGRISKQVPVLLLGTDTSGRVFSEETSTLVLSRHGAGILSHNKLAPDERLTLRQVGFSPEAEARLVGQIGQQGDAYVYGIEFTDSNINFWQIEFPLANLLSDPPAGLMLECSLCGSRQAVRQSDIEADVYAVNDSILRYCESCGISTNWRDAKPGAPLPPAQPVPAHSPLALPEPVLAVANSSLLNAAIHQIEIELDPCVRQTAASCAAVLDLPATNAPSASAAARPGGNGVNRRRDVRTSVKFTACVRQTVSGDEIVECDDISKGGASFRSRRNYEQDSLIEIAAPYSPGGHAIFVSATIKHVDELPARLFRYGVAYIKSAKHVFDF